MSGWYKILRASFCSELVAWGYATVTRRGDIPNTYTVKCMSYLTINDTVKSGRGRKGRKRECDLQPSRGAIFSDRRVRRPYIWRGSSATATTGQKLTCYRGWSWRRGKLVIRRVKTGTEGISPCSGRKDITCASIQRPATRVRNSPDTPREIGFPVRQILNGCRWQFMKVPRKYYRRGGSHIIGTDAYIFTRTGNLSSVVNRLVSVRSWRRAHNKHIHQSPDRVTNIT